MGFKETTRRIDARVIKKYKFFTKKIDFIRFIIKLG